MQSQPSMKRYIEWLDHWLELAKAEDEHWGHVKKVLDERGVVYRTYEGRGRKTVSKWVHRDRDTEPVTDQEMADILKEAEERCR